MTLLDRLVLPAALTAEYHPSTQRGLDLATVMTFDASDRRYVGNYLTFSSPVVAVRSSSVKTTAVRDSLIPGLRAALAEHNAELIEEIASFKTYFRGTTGRAVAASSITKPGPDLLEQVALIHATARSIGDFPVLAVTRCFRLDRRQGNRWVNAARRRGFLW